MNYKGKEFNTMAEVFNEALSLAQTDRNDALDFFVAYVEYILEDNEKINTFSEAERIAKANLGYFAGYYTPEICDIIYRTYQCSHPVFGDKPFSIDPEEAYKKGLEIGSKLRQNELL